MLVTISEKKNLEKDLRVPAESYAIFKKLAVSRNRSNIYYYPIVIKEIVIKNFSLNLTLKDIPSHHAHVYCFKFQ